MSTSSNAVPTPAPESGSSNPTPAVAGPQLTVVPPPEPAARRPRSVLNRAQLRELDLAQGVATAAQREAYVAPLRTRQIEPAFVTQLLADIAAAHRLNTAVLESVVGGQIATQAGVATGEKLTGGLRRIQTAARQQYLHSDPLKLKEYLVGENIKVSRPVLEQSSQTLLDKAGAERPAGLDTSFLQQVEGERAAYVQTDTTQAGEVSDARQERARRAALVESIKQRRQKLQLAAEFLWPSTDAANAGARQEFGLPVNRPYVG